MADPNLGGTASFTGGVSNGVLQGGMWLSSSRVAERLDRLVKSIADNSKKIEKSWENIAKFMRGSSNGGTGSGNGLNLGLGSLTTSGQRWEGAGLAALGVGKLAMAGGAFAYGMMPGVADVMARNRLAYSAGLGSSWSANQIGRWAASNARGRFANSTDPYLTAATLSMSGYSMSTGYGRNAYNAAANLGLLTGQPAPDIAATLGQGLTSGTMGFRLQMLGISNVDPRTRNPASFSQMADALYQRLQVNRLKTPEQLSRNLVPGSNLALNLDYYVPDPAMRQQVEAYFKMRNENGGRPVDLGKDQSALIKRLGGGVLDAESAMRGYYGSETDKIEKFGKSVGEGATAAFKFAKKLNDAMSEMDPALQKIGQLSGIINAFMGTSAGQSGLLGATMALSALASVANGIALIFGAKTAASVASSVRANSTSPGGGARPTDMYAPPGASSSPSAKTMPGAGFKGALGVTAALTVADWAYGNWGPAGPLKDAYNKWYHGQFDPFTKGLVSGNFKLKEGGLRGLFPGTSVTNIDPSGDFNVNAQAVYDWALRNDVDVNTAQAGYQPATMEWAKSALRAHGIGGGSSQRNLESGGIGGALGSPAATSPTGNAIVDFASKFVGNTEYTPGGENPQDGFDCARFVWYVFSKMGIQLPKTSWEQSRQGTKVDGLGAAKPGDLLFFHYANGHKRDNQTGLGINHVAIYAGGGKMVEAANPSADVRKGNVDTKNLVLIKRVINGKLSEAANKVLSETLNITESASGGYLGGDSMAGGSYSVTSTGVSFATSSISNVLSTSGLGALARSSSSSKQASDQTTTSSDASTSGGTVPQSKVGKGGKWLMQFLYNKGLRGDTLKRMWMIAMRESGGNPSIDNGPDGSGHGHYTNPDHSIDYGLFQINSAAHADKLQSRGWTVDDLRDPNKNYTVMMQISHGGTDFGAWGIRNPNGSLTGWAKHLADKYGMQKVLAYERAMYSHADEFGPTAHAAGIPGYSKGAWAISRDQTARVHAGEMILPASVAEAVRTTIRSGPAGGLGGPAANVIINVSLEGRDADGVRFAQNVKRVLEGSRRAESIART